MVETREKNEARKDCVKFGFTSCICIDGVEHQVQSAYTCPHSPPCIFRVVDMILQPPAPAASPGLDSGSHGLDVGWTEEEILSSYDDSLTGEDF